MHETVPTHPGSATRKCGPKPVRPEKANYESKISVSSVSSYDLDSPQCQNDDSASSMGRSWKDLKNLRTEKTPITQVKPQIKINTKISPFAEHEEQKPFLVKIQFNKDMNLVKRTNSHSTLTLQSEMSSDSSGTSSQH